MEQAEAEELTQSGTALLRAGDAAGARAAFERVIAARAGPLPLLPLAQACKMLGDYAAEDAVLAQLLEAHPRNIGVLILRGDNFSRRGDDRAAVSFYRRALNIAAGVQGEIPANLAAELHRAEAAAQAAQGKLHEHLEQRLAAASAANGGAGARFARSLDILAGRRGVYLQQPTTFYYPELPNIQFYERDRFDWVAALEAETGAIRDELLAVMAEEGSFAPYVQPDPDRPRPANRLVNNPDWSAYYLWQSGAPVADHAARCPRTMAALARVPMPVIDQRSPMALFSLLKPGTHIHAHNGLINTRLICHLPLIVPPGCRFRVGNEVREWEEGKLTIFDDSVEHEAWNDGSDTRVVLLFEVWRPEIDAAERAALTTLFEAIGEYQGVPQDQG